MSAKFIAALEIIGGVLWAILFAAGIVWAGNSLVQQYRRLHSKLSAAA